MSVLNGLTIAGRYTAIRKQFSKHPGSPETPILEYQTTQYRLIPHLATLFTLKITSNVLREAWQQDLEKFLGGDQKALNELHPIVSSIKPIFTYFAADAVRECRHLMGGLGYSKYSRLGSLYDDLGLKL